MTTTARRLLTVAEAAQYLGVSRRSLYRLGLRPVIVGARAVRYDVRDLDRYIERRKATRG